MEKSINPRYTRPTDLAQEHQDSKTVTKMFKLFRIAYMYGTRILLILSLIALLVLACKSLLTLRPNSDIIDIVYVMLVIGVFNILLLLNRREFSEREHVTRVRR